MPAEENPSVAAQYLVDCRRRIDAFAEQRIGRLGRTAEVVAREHAQADAAFPE